MTLTRDQIEQGLRLVLDEALNEWDAEPMLATIEESGEDHSLIVAPFPLANLWGAMPPHQVIHAVASVVPRLASIGVTPRPVLGVFLVSEGWGVKVPKDSDPQAVSDWVNQGNSLADYPDRVEVKMLTAMFTDGAVFALTHERGSAMEPRQMDSDMEGRIPQAMTALLTALTEATP